jgi:hypothetical protein
MPLLEVVDNNGAADPAQKGRMAANVGVNTGLDKISPILSWVVQPFMNNSKSV